jgi:hypothetical protein
MPRPQRIEYEGAVYHVTARGNERRAIFHDDADRERFLCVLGVRNGASVSEQLSRLAQELESNRSLRNRVREIEGELKCRRNDR